MRPSVVATLALASSLLVPRLAGALTLEDCELWLQQLQGEASQVQVGGAQGASESEALLSDLKQASLRRKGTTPADSAKDVSHFKKRAAQLSAQGNVSRLGRRAPLHQARAAAAVAAPRNGTAGSA